MQPTLWTANAQPRTPRRPPEQDTIASREDLYRDPSLVWDQPNPSHPYIFPDRDWKIWSALYETPPAYPDLLEDRTHSMDYRLRPSEEMTRLFHHRGRWVVFPNYPGAFRRWPSETGPEGPSAKRYLWIRPSHPSARRPFQERSASSLDEWEPGLSAAP